MPFTTSPGQPGRVERDDLWNLVTAAQRGNREAFGELYTATHPEILRYLTGRVRSRHTAEDLAAETYIKAWRYLAGLRRTRESPVGWLKTIAARLVITHAERACNRVEVLSDEILPRTAEGRPEHAERHDDPAAETAHRHLDLATVWKAAQSLTGAQRDALIGRYLLGLPLEDAAVWMGGRTTDSVRNLACRAAERLRSDPRVAALHPARFMAGA